MYPETKKGIAVTQAVISKSAMQKAEEAGPDGMAKFIVRLSDVLLTPEEVSALRQLGMIEYLPLFHQAFIALPGRCLLDVAELPSVVQVV